MESATAIRPSLPPISFLDSDKPRREDTDYQPRHMDVPPSTAVTSHTLSAPYPTPTGPPPPYSASSHPSIMSITGPSQPHHELGPKRVEEQDSVAQSLPSLSEALGVQRKAPQYLAEPLSASQGVPPAQRSLPPSSPRRASGGSASPQRSYGHYQPAYTQSDRPAGARSFDYGRPEYAERNNTLHHRSPISNTPHHPRAPFSNPEPDRQYQTSPRVPPPHPTFSYGYSQAPAAPYTSAPTAGPAGYQPHPTSDPASTWRPGVNGATHAAPQRTYGEPVPSPAPQRAYGESVKRHLDLFDFELALGEIAEHSTVTLDFSRSYGARLHNIQRSGPVPGTLPAITEVEDLMNKSRQTMDALGRLREVLVAQQAAYYQHAQENNARLDQDAKRNDSVHQDELKAAGGFAGGEPKKRKGRNAAPGRCHSCNRAETPEWRRGPDGARTLCNACGLHYAKLTRKAAGANKGAAIGSSNLRPRAQEDAEA